MCVIEMQCAAAGPTPSLPLPPETSDPGPAPVVHNPEGCAYPSVEHTYVEETMTLTDPCIWKIMIREGKEDRDKHQKVC